MGIRIGGETVGGIRIGGETVGGLKLGSETVYRKQTAPTAQDHAYTIVVGTTIGLLGWWDGQMGSITNGQVTLPNGSTTDIRQTMTAGNLSTNLRFLVRGSTNRALNQYPPTIETSRAGNTIRWTRGDRTQTFGQGTGVDYATTQGGLITTVFQIATTVNVLLKYTT